MLRSVLTFSCHCDILNGASQLFTEFTQSFIGDYMTNTERLIYLAGVFDGEGSICIGKAHISRTTHHHTRHYQIQVHVGMQSKKVIDQFALAFGGEPKRNSSQVWRVAYSTAKAAEVIRQLEPWLICKKPQARVALYFQSVRCTRRGRKGYTEEECRRDLRLHSIVSHLNKRDSVVFRKPPKQQTD
jgi:hypothetical protein